MPLALGCPFLWATVPHDLMATSEGAEELRAHVYDKPRTRERRNLDGQSSHQPPLHGAAHPVTLRKPCLLRRQTPNQAASPPPSHPSTRPQPSGSPGGQSLDSAACTPRSGVCGGDRALSPTHLVKVRV